MTDVETRLYQRSIAAVLADVELDGRPGRFSTMQGRAVPYDTWANVGWFVERHAFESFKRSTDNAASGLPLLMFHDNRQFPIGKSSAWEHRGDGLLGTWEVFASAEAQRAAAAAHDGELTGLSVGFMPERSEWKSVDPDEWDPDLGPDHMDHVTRLESRLMEVSLTPTPAYTDAGVTLVRTAVRRRTPGQLTEAEAWRRRVDSLRR